MNNTLLNDIATYLKNLIETNISGVSVFDTEGEFISNQTLPAIVIKFVSHLDTHQDLSRNKRNFVFNLKVYTPISGESAQAERDARDLACELINLLEAEHNLGGNVDWCCLVDSGEMLVSQEEQPFRVYSCNLTATVITTPIYVT